MTHPWDHGEFWLLRHGEPADTPQSTFLGKTDPPLAADADLRIKNTWNAVEAYCAKNKRQMPGRIVTSALRRAKMTGEIVAGRLTSPLISHDSRLNEVDFGVWEGLTYEQVESKWPGQAQAWLDDPADRSGPGGETVRQVSARVGSWLTDTCAKGLDGPVLVIGHYTSLASLAAILLGVDVTQAVRIHLRRGHAGYISGGALRAWDVC
jgi:probable phosphoglycerate mutase